MSGNTKLFKKTPIALLAIAALSGSTAVLADPVPATAVDGIATAGTAYVFDGTSDTLTIKNSTANGNLIGAITSTEADSVITNIVVADADASASAVTIASIGASDKVITNLTVNATNATTITGDVFVKNYTNTKGDTKFSGNLTTDALTHTAGALTFEKALTVAEATTLNAAANFAGDTTFTKGLTTGANAVTFNGTTAAQTVTGAISSTNTVTINNSDGVTFKDAVTTKTLTQTAGALTFEKALTVADATTLAAAANFAGDTTFTKGLTAGTHAVTFNGAAAQTITGNINGTSTISVANTAGKVTFADTVTANAMTVTANNSIQLNKTNNAIIALTLVNGSSLYLGDAIANGTTVNTGDLLLANGETATVFMPTTLKDLDSVTLSNTITGLSGTLNVHDTALFDYTRVDEKINVAAKSAADTATDLGSTAQVGASLQLANTAINNLPGTTEAELTLKAALQEKLSTALNAGGTTALAAAEQVAIQTDMLGSTAAAATQTGTAVFNVASNRLASVRGGSQFSGIATGDMPAMNGVWARTFGNWTEQDTHDGSYGFDADTYGVAFGMDREIADDVRLGASLAYASTDVDGKGAGNFQNDIDTYQFTVYGDYTVDTYYVEGMVGYATNSNDTSHVALGSTVKADYDSSQWMARVAAGMPYMMGETMYVTPNASLAYTHLSTDNYTEKGDLSKYVQIDDVDSLVGTLDVKIHSVMNTENGGSFIPSAHAGVSYEFGDNNVSSTGNFVGQTTKFNMKSADAEEFSGILGAGVDYTAGQWTVGAKYDASLNADSTSHNASLEARFEF